MEDKPGNGRQDVAAVGMMIRPTAQLIENMKTGSRGDRRLFEDLATLTGRTFGTVDGRPGTGNGCLATAIRRCIADHGLVWQVERGAGCIVCLGPAEIRETVKAATRSIARKAKRAGKKLQTVALGELSTEDGKEHLSLCAQVGTVAAMASTTMQKKLLARNVVDPLDTGRLLEGMKKQGL